MYDILQLNDMLVPELLDIAEQLAINGTKKMDKQELIYKILDKQALMASEKKESATEKAKRKRIVKANTSNTTEEAEVMEEAPKREKQPAEKKKVTRKPRKETADSEPEAAAAPAKEAASRVASLPPDIKQIFNDVANNNSNLMEEPESGSDESDESDGQESENGGGQTQQRNAPAPRKEPAFNIEF